MNIEPNWVEFMLLLYNPQSKTVASRVTRQSRKQMVLPKPPSVFYLVPALSLSASLLTSALHGSKYWSIWWQRSGDNERESSASWALRVWRYNMALKGEKWDGKRHLLSSPEFRNQWVQMYKILIPSGNLGSTWGRSSKGPAWWYLRHQEIQAVT